MKATCPKDPTHNRFITCAHVMEDWLVDEHGNFEEQLLVLETIHGPCVGNVWTCAICHTEAVVTNAKD